jgi:alpha-beta hydrolase superfamily lysophospholipase
MRLSGYMEPSLSDMPVFTGRVPKDNYVIEKYFVKGEGDYVLPYLLFIPDNPNRKAVIYLHPEGKSGIMKQESEVEWLMEHGFTVLAPDLPGTGKRILKRRCVYR